MSRIPISRNAPGIKSSPVFHHLEYKTLKLIKTKLE